MEQSVNLESQSKSQQRSSDERVTYPTGVQSAPQRQSKAWHLREALLAPGHTHFCIYKKFDSLDYERPVTQMVIHKDRQATFRLLMCEEALRVLTYVMTGALTAAVGVTLQLGVMALGNVKYNNLRKYIDDHHDGTLSEQAVMTLYWCLSVTIPIMVGSALVVFIAPFAAGGGVAQAVAYLNGVRVPSVLSIRGLFVKLVSTMMCCISGLAGGKEGPMMHMGLIIGGSLPSVMPTQGLKSDHERRDLAAAGFGAGIAVAFGAPIGGLLLALEEGVSFWNTALMWRCYICILVAYFTASLIMSIVFGIPGELRSPELVVFGKISDTITDYELFELGLFAVLGLVGGLCGASLIKLHVYITLLRKRFVQTKLRKLTEAFIVSLLIAAVGLTTLLTLRTCSDTTITTNTHQMYCGEGQFSDISLLLFQTQEGFIHSMFGSEPVQVSSLFVFCCIYYVLICLTMGLSISAGLFVPQIVLGAAYGRILGIYVQHLWPNAAWAKPAKYAYVGAAAQLSGTVGKTFSVLVIMVEAAASISFSIPLMVVVSITKYVLTFFIEPIYETQMLLMGLPVLASEPPAVSKEVTTGEVMCVGPLVSLPLTPTVHTVLRTLNACQHNGFPILNGKVLNGLILRQQLLVLLKYKAYKYPTPTTAHQMRDCYDFYLKEARKVLNIQNIEVNPQYYGMVIDLTPYYNPHPYTVRQDTPLMNTYNLFRGLGLRHVVVIGNNNEALGMITRKDLAKYHTHTSLCRMGVKELPVM